jgi:hypothetical protein
MPLSGQLLADFTSFTQASADATVSLTSFETGADKVTSALDRASNGLSGTKLIQNATLMAEAVDRVGGVSTLTTAELAKVSAQAQEAAEKLTALGQDVPPKIQAIADAGKNVSTGLTDMLPNISGVAAAFGVAFSINAAVGFFNTVTEGARSLQILSLQTQTSTDELQILAAATKEFGVDQDQLGRAIFQLGQRIAGGDDSVVTGLALMGLKLQDVENLHGADLFLTVERAAGTLNGTIRDTAEADLFGAKLGSSLGALSKGIDEAYDKAGKLNTRMSKESIDAAADYAKAIDQMGINIKATATNAIGSFAMTANGLKALKDSGVSDFAIFSAMWKDGAQLLTDNGSAATNLAKLFDDMNQKAIAGTKAATDNAGAHATVVAVLTKEQEAEQFMATLRANNSVTLTAQQIKNLDELKATDELNAKTAEGIGVNAAQLKVYLSGLTATADAARILAEVEAEASAAALAGYTARVAGLAAVAKASLAAYSTDGQIAALQALDAAEQLEAVNAEHFATDAVARAKIRTDAEKAHQALTTEIAALRQKELALTNAGVVEALTTQTAYNNSIGLDSSGAVKIAVTALDTLNDRLKVIAASHTTEEAKVIEVTAAYRDYDTANLAAAVAQDKVNFGVAAVPGLATAASASLKGLTTSYYAAADAAIALTIAASNGLVSVTGTRAPTISDPGFSSSTIGQISSGGLHPLRAAGGPVSAGTTYMVGEKGPELYTAGANGFITPNGGGGTTVLATLNLSALTPGDARVNEALRQYVEALITTALGNRVHLGN